MFTPEGFSARKIEKVMLLALWANELNERLDTKDQKMIFAGLGKPTYPINQRTVESYLNYWQRLNNLAAQWHSCPETAVENPAINYGDPRGDKKPRTIMAERMSQWYECDVRPEHVLFTVGGIGGLRAIFDTFNSHFQDLPGYRIITPFPHYSVYANDPMHQLHPIPVMNNPGYKLTAKSLQESIDLAYELAEEDKGFPKALLLCNPSNPLGNIIDEHELIQIADVLRNHPDLYIIFDEAYAEMSFKPMPSFLKIAPDLKQRVIILRSATKALSAAGERMAILLVFDPEMMNELLNKNINYFIHVPRSAQIAYAETMASFDYQEQRKLSVYYEEKVAYVLNRLAEMGASMPDPCYKVEATFYALGDFSDLFGLPMPEEALQVFQKISVVTTDEDITYYLLFNDAVMVAPLSYFGLEKDSGFMRITCSATKSELEELMNRLEQRLIHARQIKKETLVKIISEQLSSLKAQDPHVHELITAKLTPHTSLSTNSKQLKVQLNALGQIKAFVEDCIALMK
ncbi:pyridoxal phosphate-dependent aminotransferase [Legionella worsleiensis]|uniref:Aminotransferase n=1 Tax=Legionella worsleiensis TaxID=45076 RepID=A0A0W1AGB5_9GAMM|nr:pyridoxal phosphate-dependent aminotransferase [Legionella worsleiensis]KTD80345.1 aspartate aminotransferase A [Legionella worsleiensis]STY32750.1 kynurenine--oxoglutarate transaminase [Legionella worsleiensis]